MIRVPTAVLAAALLRGVLLAWLLPPFQTPDEYAHYDYALYLSYVGASRFVSGDIARPTRLVADRYTTAELYAVVDAVGQRPHLDRAVIVRPPPSMAEARQRIGQWRAADDEPERLTGLGELNGVFNYPPLYHKLAGAVVRAGRLSGLTPVTCFYLARLFSLLLFLTACWMTWHLTLALGTSHGFAQLVTFLVAFHPELSMLSVSVQPDNLSLLLVTAGLYALVRFSVTPSTGSACAVGVTVGLLLLTKTHLALPLAATFAVTLAMAAWRGAIAAQLLTWLTAALLLALALGGWWYVRSHLLFDNWRGVIGFIPVDGAGGGDRLRVWWSDSIPLSFRTWWGVWGWIDYGLPRWTLPWLGAVSVLPAIVLMLMLRARRDTSHVEEWQVAKRALIVIVTATGLFAIEMIAIAAVMGRVQNQGRHWLPYAYPQLLYLAAPVAALTPRFGRATAAWLAGRLRLVAAAVWLLAGVGVIGAVGSLAVGANDGTVEIVATAGADTTAEIFYDVGRGFNPIDRVSVEVRPRDGQSVWQFPVRGATVRRLRFDPGQVAATTTIASARLLDADGREAAVFAATRLRALNQIAAITPAAGTTLIRTTVNASDPSIELVLDTPAALDGTWMSRSLGPIASAWRRVLLRWPWLSGLDFWWPTLLGVAALLSWLAREPAASISALRARETWRPAAPAVWAAGLVAVFLAADLTLVVATLDFYGMR